MRQMYIATVQLLIDASGRDEACSVITNMLTEYPDPKVKDWAYLRVGGQLLSPAEILISPEGYEEGDFLT